MRCLWNLPRFEIFCLVSQGFNRLRTSTSGLNKHVRRTLGGLHDQGLAVLAHSAGVKGLHPGLVRAVKMEAVHRADGLRPHVDLLQRHTVSNYDAGLADLPSLTTPHSAALPLERPRFGKHCPRVWARLQPTPK